jgi:hypothetical protein
VCSCHRVSIFKVSPPARTPTEIAISSLTTRRWQTRVAVSYDEASYFCL